MRVRRRDAGPEAAPSPPAHWGPSPFPFTLAVIWVENNELPLCSSLRFRCHGLVFCVKPNLSSAVSFEFRCLRNRILELEETSQFFQLNLQLSVRHYKLVGFPAGPRSPSPQVAEQRFAQELVGRRSVLMASAQVRRPLLD